MIEGKTFSSQQEFMEWFRDLNPSDEIDMEEAIEIYFNMEKYEEVI